MHRPFDECKTRSGATHRHGGGGGGGVQSE